MAADVALLESVGSGYSAPVLRLYAWFPTCLSIGYGQRAAEVDFDRLEGLGWSVVRRPTGGRAILHTDELTYSVVIPVGDPLAFGSVIDSYQRLSRALMVGVSYLGVRPHSEAMGTGGIRAEGPVCFEVPSHYEITVDGRKLVGSAQVRRSGGVLQHGSIPLDGDLARICDGLVYPDVASREGARVLVRQRALTLSQAAGQTITWDAAAAAIVAGFETALDVQFERSMFSKAEQARMQELSIQFADQTWICRR